MIVIILCALTLVAVFLFACGRNQPTETEEPVPTGMFRRHKIVPLSKKASGRAQQSKAHRRPRTRR